MQRKAYVPGRSGSAAVSAATLLALGLGIALTGCSSGSAGGADAIDSKAGPAASASVAPPGRYRTLFAPCGAVPPATLKDLLPGAAALPDAERDRAYRGTAAATFDTDRRVGCSWKSTGPDATHRLSLDIERVVSYDTTVSDDDRAQQVYERKQTAAGIAPPASTTPTTPASPPPGKPTDKPTGKSTDKSADKSGDKAGDKPADKASETVSPTAGHTATHTAADAQGTDATTGGQNPVLALAGGQPGLAPYGPEAPTPTAGSSSGGDNGGTSGTTEAPGLEPRTLDGLGDVAYLDDTLLTAGPSGERRLVSVVFRTSNVIVTVAYEEETAASGKALDREELQDKARNLAGLLAERLEE
ncbi:DUF3558 domain-containing protein [Streptomyces sp. NPDC046203]|uniref:DUF3558 domain-containing protein n=1 Tax=Streptomyces sp. NPDC046203 TaxID=3154602 RepID=UPI0033CF4213